MRSAWVVVNTRPGPAGERLHGQLTAAGVHAEHWPLFELRMQADAAARAALNDLQSYDCVVFVSPAAVAAVAAQRSEPWPQVVAIAAVGEATAQAVRQSLSPAANTQIVVPPSASNGNSTSSEASGAQALWPALETFLAARTVPRVLIVRAQQGRDWLVQRLTEAGAQVTCAAVYQRHAQPLSPAQGEQLAQWLHAGRRILMVVTSSEAVDVLLNAPAHERSCAAALRAGQVQVCATHERIAQRLRQCGVPRVSVRPAASSALLQYLIEP